MQVAPGVNLTPSTPSTLMDSPEKARRLQRTYGWYRCLRLSRNSRQYRGAQLCAVYMVRRVRPRVERLLICQHGASGEHAGAGQLKAHEADDDVQQDDSSLRIKVTYPSPDRASTRDPFLSRRFHQRSLCESLHEVGNFDCALQALISNQRLGVRRPSACATSVRHAEDRIPQKSGFDDIPRRRLNPREWLERTDCSTAESRPLPVTSGRRRSPRFVAGVPCPQREFLRSSEFDARNRLFRALGTSPVVAQAADTLSASTTSGRTNNRHMARRPGSTASLFIPGHDLSVKMTRR